jgi:hypothetical protein
MFVHERKRKAYKNLDLRPDKEEIRLLRLQPGYPYLLPSDKISQTLPQRRTNNTEVDAQVHR